MLANVCVTYVPTIDNGSTAHFDSERVIFRESVSTAMSRRTLRDLGLTLKGLLQLLPVVYGGSLPRLSISIALEESDTKEGCGEILQGSEIDELYLEGPAALVIGEFFTEMDAFGILDDIKLFDRT